MIRNEIPRICFYFCSTERNSELFSLPLKGSEGNSESSLLFLFHGTEFRVVFSSAEGFGTEFREFSVRRNSRNSVRNNHLFRLFRLPHNYFFVGNSQPYFYGHILYINSLGFSSYNLALFLKSTPFRFPSML
jgi:hypothetical protein